MQRNELAWMYIWAYSFAILFLLTELIAFAFPAIILFWIGFRSEPDDETVFGSSLERISE